MEILDKLNLASTEVKIKGKGSVVLPEVAEDNVNYVVGVDSEGKANVNKISFFKDLKSTDTTLSGNSEFYKSVSIDKEEGNLSVVNKYYNELTGLRTEGVTYINDDEIAVISKDNESGDSETHIFSNGILSTGQGAFLCSIFSPFIVAGYELDDTGTPKGSGIVFYPEGFTVVSNVNNNITSAKFIFDKSKTTTSSSTYTIATTEDIPDSYTKSESDEKYVKLGENNGSEYNAKLFVCIGSSDPYISISDTVESESGIESLIESRLKKDRIEYQTRSESIPYCLLFPKKSGTIVLDEDLSNYVENGNSGTQYWIPNAVLGAESGCTYGAKIRTNGNNRSVDFLTNTTGLTGECIVMSIECGADHVSFHALPEMYYCCTGNVLAPTKETQFVTKKYVDDSICTATENLVTKSVQSPAQSSGTWTVSLDSNYTSAPFVQVFDGENKIVFPSIKFVAPNSLEIEFDGKDSIAQGEFTAVISTPFTSTVELDETVVTINSDQGISGVKNFTGTLQYQGSEVAKKSEIPSLNGYATEDFVANCINEVEIPDVSSFITKDVDNLTNYTKTTELVSDYAKKTDLNGLATQQYVDGKIPTDYVSTTKTESQSIKSALYVPDLIVTSDSTGETFVEILPSSTYGTWFRVGGEDGVSVYSLKKNNEVGSILNIATEKYVDDKVEEIDIPEINEFISLADYGIKGTCAQAFEVQAQELSFSACTSICFYLTSVTNVCNFVFNVPSSTQGIQVLQKTDNGCYVSEITPYRVTSNEGSFATVSTCSAYIGIANIEYFESRLPKSTITPSDSHEITTKKYVDDKVDSATQHLKTKSYQSVETTGDKWTITLDSEYSSAPFFQVFNNENSIVYPEVKFTAPSTLELTFEGKEGIGLGEFTAVVSVPFTTTITPNESYVSIGTAQGISGKKNFTTVPTINSVDIATVDNLSTTENSVRSYVDTEISAKIASVYRFKGDSTYASLPDNAQVGDVYNLTTASGEYKIGDNVAWTGSKWDKLAATVDLSGYLTTSSASSTYLTISSANSTYATKTDALSKTLTAEQSIAGPVTFNGSVSVSELEIDNLSLETLEIGNEINVNGIAVSESISNLNAKTGSLEYVLPAKDPSSGIVEWEITINTDLTKTVKCPPNVIVCDITGERYKYVVCDVEWDGANKIYIKFDNYDNIEDNQFKAYITNIQLQ